MEDAFSPRHVALHVAAPVEVVWRRKEWKGYGGKRRSEASWKSKNNERAKNGSRSFHHRRTMKHATKRERGAVTGSGGRQREKVSLLVNRLSTVG